MNADTTLTELMDETVPAEHSKTTPRGLLGKGVIGLFTKMPLGGLRFIHEDGHVRHFGQKGAPVTAEIRVHNDQEFFRSCALYGNIGLGEAYTDGLWSTKDIAAVIAWFADNAAALQGTQKASHLLPGVNWLRLINRFRHLGRSNTVKNSRRNIAEHYDLGNDFYRLWLDPTMTYSSARFEHEGQSLESAQTGKYEALCRKLRLKSSDHVLEIGCGWGGFSCYAAKTYGCRITALTVSEAQAAYARQRVLQEGLTHLVEIRIQDYRHVQGQFDKIASIEMIEAVGDRFHHAFFAQCHEVLAPHGMLGLQMITVPDHCYTSLKNGVDWIQKHIFPGSLLLSIGRVNEVLRQTGDLFLHDLEDMGADYARTLSLWHDNFNANLAGVRGLGFDEPFIRSWNYYLKYCEAGFATRNISAVQAVYTRPNNPGLRNSPVENRKGGRP